MRPAINKAAVTAMDRAARELIRLALAEDLGGRGDLSTDCFIPRGARLRGSIVAKQSGVLCGMRVAEGVFRRAAPSCRFRALARDGARLRPGQTVARVWGPREILTAERTALNFLQRMSGVATLTRRYTERLRGTKALLLDTRKTLPGWRSLDKYAVLCGGSANHRFGLYDMVMLKDNHLEWIEPSGNAALLRAKIDDFRRTHPKIPVLIEAKNAAQVDLALQCAADILLLDNMPPAKLRLEIRRIRRRSPKTLIEVSGGVTLENIRVIAKLGVDRISVGRLTHSAPALDLSLEVKSA